MTLAQVNLEKAQERARKENHQDEVDRLEEQKKRAEELNRIRREQIRLAVESAIAQSNLGLVGKEIGDQEAELQKILEQRVQTLRALAVSDEEYLNVEEKISKILKTNITEGDSYAVVFDNLRERAESYFDDLANGTVKIDDVRESLRKYVLQLFQTTEGALDPRQLDDFFFYTEEYIRFFDKGLDMLVTNSVDSRKKILKEFEQAAIDMALLRGDI